MRTSPFPSDFDGLFLECFSLVVLVALGLWCLGLALVVIDWVRLEHCLDYYYDYDLGLVWLGWL